MKPSRRLYLFLAVTAVAIAAIFLLRRGGLIGKHPEVAIQDRKTIDFSSGQPVVKDSANEQAIIDAAVKEMDDAMKDVTFTAPATSATATPPAPAGNSAAK